MREAREFFMLFACAPHGRYVNELESQTYWSSEVSCLCAHGECAPQVFGSSPSRSGRTASRSLCWCWKQKCFVRVVEPSTANHWVSVWFQETCTKAAPMFAERTQDETLHEENQARGVAWDLAKSVHKLKKKDKVTFYSPVQARETN